MVPTRQSTRALYHQHVLRLTCSHLQKKIVMQNISLAPFLPIHPKLGGLSLTGELPLSSEGLNGRRISTHANVTYTPGTVRRASSMPHLVHHFRVVLFSFSKLLREKKPKQRQSKVRILLPPVRPRQVIAFTTRVVSARPPGTARPSPGGALPKGK